jgi:hypothetical protein
MTDTYRASIEALVQRDQQALTGLKRPTGTGLIRQQPLLVAPPIGA